MAAPSSESQYKTESLATHHDRAGFFCGVPELDSYLRLQARQDMERNLASTFVLTTDSRTIAGFYTLSASSILAADLPEAIAKKLLRLPLPVTLLGRMAVAESVQGTGLGEAFLMLALERALKSSRTVASWAMIVDAKEGARGFYAKYEFIPFASQPNRLFLPMKTIEKLITRSK